MLGVEGYTIKGANSGNNYAVTAVTNASGAITPAPLTITANDATKVYGAALPTLTASFVGFVNDDTPASLSTPASLTTPAVSTSPVGTYPIAGSGASSP